MWRMQPSLHNNTRRLAPGPPFHPPTPHRHPHTPTTHPFGPSAHASSSACFCARPIVRARCPALQRPNHQHPPQTPTHTQRRDAAPPVLRKQPAPNYPPHITSLPSSPPPINTPPAPPHPHLPLIQPPSTHLLLNPRPARACLLPHLAPLASLHHHRPHSPKQPKNEAAPMLREDHPSLKSPLPSRP